jgi:hypothetical protein
MRSTIFNKSTFLYLLIFLSVVFSNCQHSRPASPPKTSTRSFAARFNGNHEDVDLLLSCVAYAVEKTKGLNIDSVSDFYEITSQFRAYGADPGDENIDSSLEAFIAANKKVDFNSREAEQRIFFFKNSLYLVGSIIEGGIRDDADEENMKLLEEKIDKIPAIAKIYRSYIAKDRDPGSLSSGEGSTLLVHLSYYFSIQDPHKRNELLKKLL